MLRLVVVVVNSALVNVCVVVVAVLVDSTHSNFGLTRNDNMVAFESSIQLKLTQTCGNY